MDTGHVKQVAAFEKLVGFCNAHGAMFNPSKDVMKATALHTLLTSARESLEVVRTARTVYINAVNERKDTFKGIPKLMTRVVNALASSGASTSMVEDAYRFIRKFYRAAKGSKTISSAANGSPPSIPVTRSTSQLDFDSQVENFQGFIELVKTESQYQPAEEAIQIQTLLAMVQRLREMNTAVMNALVNFSIARAARNQVLYESTGIYGRALAVKRYIKGAFGFRSDAYNQVSSLRFAARAA